jgi:CheY-like chemotaxis protein
MSQNATPDWSSSPCPPGGASPTGRHGRCTELRMMADIPRRAIDSRTTADDEDEAATSPRQLTVRAAAGAPEAAWRVSARTPVEPRSRPFRILVAEDDPEMRCVVADTLREDGYDVVDLADGGRLLVDIAARMKEGADSDAVDLIVSDIRMPICTGLQILEVLRQAHWHTPVILMTAFGDQSTRKRAEDLQAVLFDKPFDMDDLRTAVATLLPRDRSAF